MTPETEPETTLPPNVERPGRPQRPVAGNVGAAGPRSTALVGAARKAAQKTARADRRRQVASLHLARVPAREIARRLGMGEGTVNADLREIRAEWRQEAAVDVGAVVSRELATLDADESKLRAEWANLPLGDRVLYKCALSDRILNLMKVRLRLHGLSGPDVTVNSATQINLGAGALNGEALKASDAAIFEDERTLRQIPPAERRAILARARVDIDLAKLDPAGVVVDPVARELSCALIERASMPKGGLPEFPEIPGPRVAAVAALALPARLRRLLFVDPASLSRDPALARLVDALGDALDALPLRRGFEDAAAEVVGEVVGDGPDGAEG